MFQYLVLLETDQEKEFFTEVYERYRNDIFHLSYRILKNESDAEDVVQEVYISLLDHMDKLEEDEPFRNWGYLAAMARNKSYNYYNRKKKYQESSLEDWWASDIYAREIDELLVDREERNLILELLKQIKSPYYEILKMRYYYGLTVQQVADELERTPGSIYQLTKTAKKRFQALLEENGCLEKYGIRVIE
ncbi:sigma-70 family RNA polymerase sigma factor [Lachnospiraceae bacterium 29-84]